MNIKKVTQKPSEDKGWFIMFTSQEARKAFESGKLFRQPEVDRLKAQIHDMQKHIDQLEGRNP